MSFLQMNRHLAGYRGQSYNAWPDECLQNVYEDQFDLFKCSARRVWMEVAVKMATVVFPETLMRIAHAWTSQRQQLFRFEQCLACALRGIPSWKSSGTTMNRFAPTIAAVHENGRIVSYGQLMLTAVHGSISVAAVLQQADEFRTV